MHKKYDTLKPSFGRVGNLQNHLFAPSIYAVFTVSLIYIIFQLRDAFVVKTVGYTAQAFVTIGLIYDNTIIAIGSFSFRDIEYNERKYNILQTLSYPRFILHAAGIPFLCVAIAEMGQTAGVEFLQRDLVHIVIVAAAIAVAIFDLKYFVDSPGITLDTYKDSPRDALERDLVRFTYKINDFRYVLSVIVMLLFNLSVGIAARNIPGSTEFADWMIFAASSALVCNAMPSPIVRFSGNLGEVLMQYGFLNAARTVYGNK